MGDKNKERNSQLVGVGNTAGNWYNSLMSDQTPLEKEYIPQSQDMWNTYQTGKGMNLADYSNIMGGYQNFGNQISQQGPTKFGFERVTANNPKEQQEAYGYMREAAPGYSEFARTGGYSPTDIQELRARGVSPIRSAYGNTMMELNRARVLGGSGGAPNYIAAASKAQREMPGQMADAMTGVNAQLAQDIRQGRLAGLSGLTGIGSTMGGLASQDAGRMLQAGMANQNADLQAQQLSEQSLQALRGLQLDALRGQTSLYGTTPGLASTFGNQALDAYRNRISLEQLRNQTGLDLLGKQISAYGGQEPSEPWWKQALGMAGSAMNMLGQPKTPTTMGPSGSTPMGYNTPNNLGGQSFQGYQPTMPSAPSGNYNPQTSGRVVGYTDPETGMYYPPDSGSYGNPYSNPYDTWNDPYLNPNLGNYFGGGYDQGGYYEPSSPGSFGGWADDPWYGYNFGPEYSGGNNYGNPWEWGSNVGSW
jgi:hypothetical protein